MTDVNHMARLWSKGCSMSQIASAMGMSRNSVAGYITRNRHLFDRRNRVVTSKPQKPREPIVTAAQQANQRRAAFHAVKVAQEAAIAPPSFPEPEIDGKEYDAARLPIAKDLLALGNCDCRWPLNDGGPFLFCAEEVVSGSVYCRHHKGRAKGKGTESERKATDALKRAA